MKIERDIIQDANRMIGWLVARDTKYRRNFNRYVNNGSRRDDIYNQYSRPLALVLEQYDEDTLPLPALNILRSCIETLISKVSQTKVRPFLNPVQGTFATRKVCRNGQVFFDEYFDKQGIYKKAIEALRDALIFEYGALWVDEDSSSIRKIAPWEYYWDPAEMNFGTLTRCMVRRRQYPLIYLADKLKGEGERFVSQLERDPSTKVEYIVYFDLYNKKKSYIVDGIVIGEKKIDYDVSPVVTIWYSPLIKGASSTSLIDNQHTLQTRIDDISEKIATALELNPSNTIFIPKTPGGPDSLAKRFTNQIGMMVEYNPIPNMGSSPVTVSTPQPIDPMYVSMLEFFEQRMYNLEGISQLSAQAKKPAGLNSGVGLDTLEDIESERHNVILQNYISFLMNVAKVIIQVFPEDDKILPSQVGRATITWKELKRHSDAFSIQFSASSSLSKEPKTKMEQVEKLLNMQIINPAQVASLLEFPDLENAYSVKTASYDACQKAIERALEEGNYSYYEVLDIQQLYVEAVNTLLRLDAADENPKVLKRLVEFIGKIRDDMMLIEAEQQPPAPPPMPDPNAGMPAPGPAPMPA